MTNPNEPPDYGMVWSRELQKWCYRRDQSVKPNPDMVWSDRHKLWMDPDNRTEEQKRKDDEIVRELDERHARGEL